MAVDLRVTLPDELIGELKKTLGPDVKPTEMLREAMTLYKWAVSEKAEGRVLLSSRPDGTDLAKLAMPSLDAIRK